MKRGHNLNGQFGDKPKPGKKTRKGASVLTMYAGMGTHIAKAVEIAANYEGWNQAKKHRALRAVKSLLQNLMADSKYKIDHLPVDHIIRYVEGDKTLRLSSLFRHFNADASERPAIGYKR
jgi:hypothetical protein